MYTKVKFRTAVIPENSTIVFTIIIMTILGTLNRWRQSGIYHPETKATLETRHRTKTKGKIKNTPQKPQRKIF